MSFEAVSYLDLGRTAASPVLRRFQGVHLSCPSLDIQSEHLRQEEGVKTLIGIILIQKCLGVHFLP